MSGEWEDLVLADLGRIVTGKTPLTSVESYFGGEIPFVTPSDMKGTKTITTTARFLSQEGAASVKGSKIPTGAVMVSCIGSDMGKVAIAGRDCVTNQQINSIIVDSRFSSEFVYYSLSTRKNEIRHQAAGGSAVPILNKGDFSRMNIAMPPLVEQKRIAHILGTLDDKIELNRRMNATLEAMARALFQSWFVDFDPVRRNAEGGDSRPEDALFPDSFEDSEIGEIPKGWKVKPLDLIADYQNGLALQKFRPAEDEEPLPIVKIAQLKSGEATWDEVASPSINPACIIDTGDVVFSWSGSLLVTVWCGGRAALNQHLFKVTSDKYPKWFCLHWTQKHLADFQRIAADKAVTMGHIKRSHLTEAMCVVPDAKALQEGTRKIAPLIEQMIALETQSRTLADLRDSLLPALLSG